MKKVRIIGMGNPRRGDDAVGMRVVELLEEQRERGAWSGTAELVAAGPDAALIAASLADGLRVLVVDAVDMGRPPGAWRVFTGEEASRAADGLSPASSHGVTVSSAVGIAAALGCAADLRIFGIQAGDMGAGHGLSEAVRASLPDVLQAIRAEAEVGS